MANGEQELVSLPERDLKLLGNRQEHLATGLRATGLDEAQMTDRDPRVQCELELRQSPAPAPLAQKRPDTLVAAYLGHAEPTLALAGRPVDYLGVIEASSRDDPIGGPDSLLPIGRTMAFWFKACVRLLRQPGGFEGVRAMPEILLPHHQAPSDLEQLEHRLAYGHAAARSVSPLLSRDEKVVSQVEHLLGIEPEVVEGSEPIPPHPEVSVVAVEDRILVGRDQVGRGAVFGFGSQARKDQVEVPTVGRRVYPPHTAGEQQPPKSRPRRQPHHPVGEQTVKGGNADGQALIQGPALADSLTERREHDSDRAHDLHILLRHRRRSIPAIDR